MATDPQLEVSPAEPTPSDLVTITATGTVPEGSTIVVTSGGDELQKSVPFGIGDIPEGTGRDKFTLQILGGDIGTFTLEVYEYGDQAGGATTDAIYYYNDAPTYAYPDEDDVAEALEEALGLEDGDVEASKSGSTLTILIGGQYAGKDLVMLAAASISGSETVTKVDALQTAGPFVFGPLQLEEGDYEADLVDEDDVSLLDDPLEFSVED